MVENETPRTRSLLRQAARNVEGGKLVAAENLYRQIIAETPESTAAWLGLAAVTQDIAEEEAAYEHVLELDAGNVEAKTGLAKLRAEPVSEELIPSGSDILESGAAFEPVPQNVHQKSVVHDKHPSATIHVSDTETLEPAIKENEGEVNAEGDHAAVYDPDVDLFCYRHPDRSTSLRCYKCNKPICSTCAVKTPVGYLCPDCQREAEDTFFNAKPTDYLLALLVALPLSLLAGWLAVRFSGGIFIILLFIFAGGAVGSFIARISRRVMGNRRGRYIPHLIAGCIVIGVLIWAFPWLLLFLAGNGRVLMKLAGIGVYLFTAASSAFYWAR